MSKKGTIHPNRDTITSGYDSNDSSYLNTQIKGNEQPTANLQIESRPNAADPKNLKYGPNAPLVEPDQNNPNERQGYKNREEMNVVEHRLMRTKSTNPDKTYRTHIERNNNQTGILKKDSNNL
jgi:hypothetical protein